MRITSSTQSLGLAIADLSQKLSEIASIMTQDAAETAASALVVETEAHEVSSNPTPSTPAGESPEQKPVASVENSSSLTSVEDQKAASVDHSGRESSTSSNPVVTIEQVRAVLAEKSQARLTGEVRKLLGSYGADKLSAVSPDRYAELIEAAKNLG